MKDERIETVNSGLSLSQYKTSRSSLDLSTLIIALSKNSFE